MTKSTDIYVKEGKLEKEFCDCLIEFSSVYIAIQIKERNENATGSNEEWFEKKANLLKKLGVGIGQKQRSASGHSVSDFEVMLQTLKLPYDIILYLQYRLAFDPSEIGKLVFEDVNEEHYETCTIVKRVDTFFKEKCLRTVA